jgi:hypothetical protein
MEKAHWCQAHVDASVCWTISARLTAACQNRTILRSLGEGKRSRHSSGARSAVLLAYLGQTVQPAVDADLVDLRAWLVA